MSSSISGPHAHPFGRKLGRLPSLWLQGLILTTFLAASSVPSPLYALYRAQWGFSPLTLTVLFSSYALAMLAAFLVFGSLSDHRGRREVILVSLVLEIAALVLFWRADSVAWLLGARILQGLATGVATSALSAGLVDLHPSKGALVNSVAPLAGLGVGALGASLLVQFAPAPTQLVYEVLLAAFVVQLAWAMWLPETGTQRPGVWRSLRPRLAVPANARAALLRVLPVNTAQWALGGFYFSLGPSLARAVSDNASVLTGGLLLGAVGFSSASAVVLARGITPRKAMMLGIAGLASGVMFTLSSLLADMAAPGLVGALVSGAGFGCAFSGSVRTLVPLAQPQERAALMSAFFAASYLAFSIPAILAGLAANHFGLQPTALAYVGASGALALLALAPWPTSSKLGLTCSNCV
jgi:predicted MFS family arabinose efflux permease